MKKRRPTLHQMEEDGSENPKAAPRTGEWPLGEKAHGEIMINDIMKSIQDGAVGCHHNILILGRAFLLPFS